MTSQLQHLADRIRSELLDLERIVNRIEEGWRRAQNSNDDFYLDSVALNLHGFYSGLEAVFGLIASRVDNQKPTGANWHQSLLQQMSNEMVTIRPAVISVKTVAQLDEYRSFRHLVRNVYSFRFDPLKMERMVHNTAPLFAQLKAELSMFALFLEQRSDI